MMILSSFSGIVCKSFLFDLFHVKHSFFDIVFLSKRKEFDILSVNVNTVDFIVFVVANDLVVRPAGMRFVLLPHIRSGHDGCGC